MALVEHLFPDLFFIYFTFASLLQEVRVAQTWDLCCQGRVFEQSAQVFQQSTGTLSQTGLKQVHNTHTLQNT